MSPKFPSLFKFCLHLSCQVMHTPSFLDHAMNIRYKGQIMYFSQSFCYLFSHGPKYFLQHLNLKHPQSLWLSTQNATKRIILNLVQTPEHTGCRICKYITKYCNLAHYPLIYAFSSCCGSSAQGNVHTINWVKSPFHLELVSLHKVIYYINKKQ